MPEPEPVKYLLAATFRHEDVLKQSISTFEEQFGNIDYQCEVFKFDHTSYYAQEMGLNLMKQFFSFTQLNKKDNLVEWKLFSIKLEQAFAQSGKRQINLDPSYLELAKIVVASTKNFDHRIYLGKGIYGDVQLRYRGGQFVANDWTYADYQSPAMKRFFHKIRNVYYRQLKCLNE